MSMNSQETDNNKNKIICSSFPSITDSDSDWDQLLTDQDLEAIDAIEAAFQSTSTSTTPSFSILNKRPLTPQNHQYRNKSRRRLPNCLLGLPKPLSLSPCEAASVKTRYPAIKFGGRIFYSRTKMEVEKAATELLQSVEAKKGEMGQVTIGFDIEWKPTFRRGALPGKAAVMQICQDTSQCHVMHIIHSGITQSLQFLLEDPTLLKVGVGIRNDCTKVFKDYNISVKAAEDLCPLANQKLGGEPKRWSLRSLTEILVGKELPKANIIRLGNWEADVLSKEQLQYAATDAFASWHLYQVLKSLQDSQEAADNEKEEPKVATQ